MGRLYYLNLNSLANLSAMISPSKIFRHSAYGRIAKSMASTMSGAFAVITGDNMTYRGRIEKGVIVMDNDPALPEGTVVLFEPMPEDSLSAPWGEVFADFIGKAEDLPPDMAQNHDHYIHGATKK
jgi:hypothetical protein